MGSTAEPDGGQTLADATPGGVRSPQRVRAGVDAPTRSPLGHGTRGLPATSGTRLGHALDAASWGRSPCHPRRDRAGPASAESARRPGRPAPGLGLGRHPAGGGQGHGTRTGCDGQRRRAGVRRRRIPGPAAPPGGAGGGPGGAQPRPGVHATSGRRQRAEPAQRDAGPPAGRDRRPGGQARGSPGRRGPRPGGWHPGPGLGAVGARGPDRARSRPGRGRRRRSVEARPRGSWTP